VGPYILRLLAWGGGRQLHKKKGLVRPLSAASGSGGSSLSREKNGKIRSLRVVKRKRIVAGRSVTVCSLTRGGKKNENPFPFFAGKSEKKGRAPILFPFFSAARDLLIPRGGREEEKEDGPPIF